MSVRLVCRGVATSLEMASWEQPRDLASDFAASHGARVHLFIDGRYIDTYPPAIWTEVAIDLLFDRGLFFPIGSN